MKTEAESKSNTVFETLLQSIVTGKYGQESRLPAERELSVQLRASRSTVRDAIRRLTEWGLVEPRRGSGIRVRSSHDWSIEVLPSYLTHASTTPVEFAHIVCDLLTLRRGLLATILPTVTARLNGQDLVQTRSLVRDAWNCRQDPGAFAAADFRMIRSLFEAAQMLPAIWTLNRVAQVYIDIAKSVSGSLPPPEDYQGSHASWLNALAKGDQQRALALLDDYFDRHDRRLLALMGMKS